jgi:hypothetical protein
MNEKVTAELIRGQGAQLRRLAIEESRARELAADVERMNNAVIDAADERLDFNDEPARFAALLAETREAGKK